MYSVIDNYYSFDSLSIHNSNKLENTEHFIDLSDIKPIEDKLHVIVVMSNPCMYKKRYKLLGEFVSRMEKTKHVELYIVELAYGDQVHQVTKENNPKHLQLRTKVPMWHKENMINLGVKYLLPSTYKAFAWIDADIEFDNNNWALDTLRILNGSKDIVQLFSHTIDMDQNKYAMDIFSSAGYNYEKGLEEKEWRGIINFWSPGFAWAMTRKAFEHIGGLYDKGILGSGDMFMLSALLKKNIKEVISVDNSEQLRNDFNKSYSTFQSKISTLKFGYTPGIILHHFHGNRKNRKYKDRWNILISNLYSPDTYITYNEKGILIPTEKWKKQLTDDIYNYFAERNEEDDE